MVSAQVCVLFALIAIGLALPRPQHGVPYGPPSYQEVEVPPKYEYGYNVVDDYAGLYYQHNEARDGYDTRGEYVVDLPDGRKQIVTYEDLGDGLVAQVHYEGEAQYPPPGSYPPPHYA